MKTIENLIQRVKENDDLALLLLFERYKPMITAVTKRYFIRNLDENDWNQEALIVCYESAGLYDFERGTTFGTFFRLRLQNRAKNLLRFELAKRRALYASAISYEALKERGQISDPSYEQASLPTSIELSNFIQTLSQLEVIALTVITGLVDLDQASMTAQVPPETIKRAIARTRIKMRAYFLR